MAESAIPDGSGAPTAKRFLKDDYIKLAELDMHEELAEIIDQKPVIITQVEANTGDS